MKKILITIVLATFLASIPVLAETRATTERTIGEVVATKNAAVPAFPQFRRRHRRRRYVIVLRRRNYRRRHYHRWRPYRSYTIRHRRRHY